MYAAAGLSLKADLATLKNAKRITADPGALAYLSDNIIYNGQLPSGADAAHDWRRTRSGGKRARLSYGCRRSARRPYVRQTFVHRAGHCEFTPAETITALQTLELRLTTGKWKDLTAPDLNNDAALLGSGLNVLDVSGSLLPTPPAFLKFEPLPFLRLFDAFTQ